MFSWKFFLNTTTELIDYPIISVLIEMDETKRILDLKFEQLLTYSYQHHKEMFTAYFINMVDSEQSLRDLYVNYFTDLPKE